MKTLSIDELRALRRAALDHMEWAIDSAIQKQDNGTYALRDEEQLLSLLEYLADNLRDGTTHHDRVTALLDRLQRGTP